MALLGIVMLAAGIPGGGLGALTWHALGTYGSGRHTAIVAYVETGTRKVVLRRKIIRQSRPTYLSF